jgi:hypothetical protein
MTPMRAAAGLVLLTVLASSAEGQPLRQPPQIEIKNAVARVVVSPRAGPVVNAQVVGGDPRLKLKVRREGGKLIVDGNVRAGRIRACQAGGAKGGHVRVTDLGDLSWNQIPQVIVSAPSEVKITASGAVFGSIGRADAVDLANDGCGDWTIDDVAGRLRIGQAGSGSSRAGRAGSAQIRIAGSGGVTMGDVGGSVNIDMAGAGAARVASVNGPLRVKLAGSGDALVQGGRASAMTATVAGAGGVTFNGVAQTLKANIAGSGDIHAAKVLGKVEKQTIGSGKVMVGR